MRRTVLKSSVKIIVRTDQRVNVSRRQFLPRPDIFEKKKRERERERKSKIMRRFVVCEFASFRFV